ncbi:Alpha/Beta hydrolase protein [Pseudoneurospora amorphoporcata]|uniref:S-formylglutathione hydrolase n=1 Tax=Pseudoneurospora amorphoporcata TaxID=241081 RepID=A0AAN6SD31_9PEZI|nr:Alpha/Beta hydrolase protein [Pseudoneurospora amorphoporcata]
MIIAGSLLYNCSRRNFLSSFLLFPLLKRQVQLSKSAPFVIAFPRRCYYHSTTTTTTTTHNTTKTSQPKTKITGTIATSEMVLTVKATIASFGGKLFKLSHPSTSTGTDMAVNLYLPPQALKSSSQKVPVLIYLSGLTCTPENCSEKGFFQHGASKRGLAVVYPDTSPRGLNLPGEKDSWDFGEGAGFYVDATQEPFAKGYKMDTYITKELPSVLFGPDSEFGKYLDAERVSITGHSMGGHGALSLYLKNPGLYKSVSAFAPIANPCECAWGKKAFGGYLGEENKEQWKKHDATELIKGEKWRGNKDARVLVDVGTGDNFYKQGQLLPENFEKAVKEAGVEGVTVRYQEDYDHSYYFMASFSDDHIDHAAKYLGLL